MPKTADRSSTHSLPGWIPLAAILGLVIGATIWWTQRAPVTIDPGPTGSAQGALPEAEAGAVPADMTEPELETSSGPREAAGAEPEAAATVEFDTARPIRGRAAPDVPLPQDESLEIVIETWSQTDRELSELDKLFAGFGDTRDWTEVARVMALVDGTFEAPRPMGATSVRLRAEGDYVCGGEVSFDIGGKEDPGDTRIELPVFVGAHVTLELEFEGSATKEEIASLAEDSLNFSSTGRSDSGAAFSGQPYQAAATLSPDGRAVMRGVRPFDWQTANASGDSSDQPLAPFRVQSGFQFEPDPGERMIVKVPMERGVRLAGFVKDENGVPIEGADIGVYGHWRSGTASGMRGGRRWSGKDGHFVFQALPADLDEFTVKAQGFLPYELGPNELAALLGAPGPHAIVLQRGRELTVQVKAQDGRPAQGVVVALTQTSEDKPARTHATNADGVALFDSLPDGEFKLSALGRLRPELQKEAPSPAILLSIGSGGRMGFMSGTDPSVETLWGASREVPSARIDAGDILSLDLGLLPQIRGQVTGADPSWAPPLIVSVYSTASPMGRFGRMAGRKGTFALDPETGRFEGQLPPGSYEAVATAGRRANGRVTPDSPKVHTTNKITFEVSTKDIELPLTFGSAPRVEGIARLGDGTPLEGVTVQLARFEKFFANVRGAAKTDSLGHFSFEGLAAGDYSLRLISSRFKSVSSTDFTIADGLPTGLLEVVAESAGAVLAEVIDSKGEPIPGASVSIMDLDWSPTYARVIEDVPEWEGAMGPLSPGVYVAVWNQESTDESTWLQRTRVTVEAGQVAKVQLRESQGGATVTGLVTSGGAPAPGIAVWLLDELGLAGGGPTDKEGRYTLSCIPTGDLRIHVGASFQLPIAAAPIGPTAGATDVPPIDLPSGAIEGKLMGDVMSTGFGQAAVKRVSDPPTAEPFRYSGGSSNGFFTIQYLPDGEYELFVTGRRSPRNEHWQPQTIKIKDGQLVRGVEIVKRP